MGVCGCRCQAELPGGSAKDGAMKFGREVQRVATRCSDPQLKVALLPYKALKKQIKSNGCIEPHVDNCAAPALPLPGESGATDKGESDSAAAPSGEALGQLLQTSPFLRFLEAELRSVTRTIEQEAQKIDDKLHASDAESLSNAQTQELATRAQALHMVFTTNQTALRKILKKFDASSHRLAPARQSPWCHCVA